jgi:hypothetical protein
VVPVAAQRKVQCRQQRLLILKPTNIRPAWRLLLAAACMLLPISRLQRHVKDVTVKRLNSVEGLPESAVRRSAEVASVVMPANGRMDLVLMIRLLMERGRQILLWDSMV